MFGQRSMTIASRKKTLIICGGCFFRRQERCGYIQTDIKSGLRSSGSVHSKLRNVCDSIGQRLCFYDVDMYSARFSRDYVPHVNVGAYLVRPRSWGDLYDATIYHGADSSGNSLTSVPADSRYRCSSFDEIIGKPQDVAASYDDAVNASAVKIPKNIRAKERPASAQPSPTR